MNKSDPLLDQVKECPNCNDEHSGMYALCYTCIDSDTEWDFETVMNCSCDAPNGFKFLEYGSDYQVWTHLKCGGIVVKPLIKSGVFRI